MQVFKNKKGRSFRPAKHRHIGIDSNDCSIGQKPVNQKISKYCPAWLARKKEINRQQQLDALLLASTPGERIRIQKARLENRFKTLRATQLFPAKFKK